MAREIGRSRTDANKANRVPERTCVLMRMGRSQRKPLTDREKTIVRDNLPRTGQPGMTAQKDDNLNRLILSPR